MASTSRPRFRAAVALGAGLVTTLVAACSPVGTSGGGSSATGGGNAPGAALDVSYGTPATADQVKQGGTLVMALSSEPDALDPTTSRSLYSRYVFNAMCEKLYDVNQDTKVVPQLASALPNLSSDGKTVTIPLRSSIKFADGTPFNAAAVKKTLERHLTMAGSGRKSELGPIASIDAKDDTTVVLHLNKPFSPLLGALTDRAGMILSPKAIDSLGDKFSQAPVCVGAFKFAKRVPQTEIDLVKDPNYYDASKVFLDGIKYRIITDPSIRAANLRSGDVQVADSISVNDVQSLKGTQGMTVLSSPSLGYQGLTFNVGNVDGVGTPAKPRNTPWSKDARVREALQYAIDRKALVQTVFNGFYHAACSPISPSSEFASDASNACPEYSVDKAKQLLKEAGVTTPLEIPILASNNSDTLRLVQAIQAMVAQAGINLKIEATEYSSLLDQQDAGKFELLQLGWSGRIDPDANITVFLKTGGGLNVSGYNNPKLDDLLDQARTTNDVAERRKLYGEAVGVIQKDSPIVYLYRQSNISAFSQAAKGVQVFPDGVVRLTHAGLSK